VEGGREEEQVPKVPEAGADKGHADEEKEQGEGRGKNKNEQKNTHIW